MRKPLLLPLLLLSLLLVECRPTQTNDKDTADSTKVDSAQHDSIATVDSTLWGRLGDGTSMHVLEFITDKGDTLYLSRTSEQTQLDAEMMGTIRGNASDRFAVTTRGKQVDEGLSLQTCINVSELMGMWKNAKTQLFLYADGSAQSNANDYTKWQIVNGKLLLSGKAQTEYGETDRTDSLRIVWLDEDSLKLQTPHHEELSFGKR